MIPPMLNEGNFIRCIFGEEAPREIMDSARRGLMAIKTLIALEKVEGRQQKSWRRKTWQYERKFRRALDTQGRKGGQFLDFYVSIVHFRAFRDGCGRIYARKA